jgi:DNA-binding IclR family transcriptional regulator
MPEHLTHAEREVLTALNAADARLSIAALIERTGLERRSVATALNGLSRRELAHAHTRGWQQRAYSITGVGRVALSAQLTLEAAQRVIGVPRR